MSKMEKKTSIIIVTYNALDYVKKCLYSIAKYTSDIHEIIVVDNDSDDDLKSFLREFSENERTLKLIFNEENLLWSPGNNVGLKAASDDSEYLMLLNSDTEVLREDWLVKLQEPFNQFENVGITGIQFNYLPYKPMYGAIDGCNFVVKKELVDKIGILNEDYPWNGAGFDFSVNAWVKGYYSYHVEDPVLIHYGKRSRVSNKVMLNNQKVDTFQLMKDAGLNPKRDYLSLFEFKLGTFNANKKLKGFLSKVK